MLADITSWTADYHPECPHLNSAQMLSHLPARDEDPENQHQPAEGSASCRMCNIVEVFLWQQSQVVSVQQDNEASPAV